MRQVPTYLIIGNGRLASHMQHYLTLLSCSVHTWCRSKNNRTQLQHLLAQATHVLVLVSDDHIEPFIHKYQLAQYTHLTILHCSGSLVTPLAHGVHPLQSFVKDTLYSLEDYQRIPFIISTQAPNFSALLPNIPNTHYRINDSDRAYYHTLCILANNVSTLLWQKFFTEMQNRFSIQLKHLTPFLEKTMENLKDNPFNSFTGPLQRGDKKSLQRNLQSLEGDEFFEVFKSLIDMRMKKTDEIDT